MEMHKRKAIESAQSAADLKLHLGTFWRIFYLAIFIYLFFPEKYHAQMKEAQQVVAEKTSSLEAEAYKTKRLQVYNVQLYYYNPILLIQKCTKWTQILNFYLKIYCLYF